MGLTRLRRLAAYLKQHSDFPSGLLAGRQPSAWHGVACMAARMPAGVLRMLALLFLLQAATHAATGHLLRLFAAHSVRLCPQAQELAGRNPSTAAFLVRAAVEGAIATGAVSMHTLHACHEVASMGWHVTQ